MSNNNPLQQADNNGDQLSDSEDLFQSAYGPSAITTTATMVKEPEEPIESPAPLPQVSTEALESTLKTVSLDDDDQDDNDGDKEEPPIADQAKPVQHVQPQPHLAETAAKLEPSTPPVYQLPDGGGGDGVQLPPATVSPSSVGVGNSETNPVPATVAVNTASQITITVSDPQKVGDGMGSYMVYTITTRTTLPYFRRTSMSVNRRFSDFLGLHSKLLMKHAHCGRIVPPPPAKSAVGTAKVKMAKDDTLQGMDFLSKRRAALERYLQRNAQHPVLCADPDFREFLELDTELPRSTSTSALSGAGVKRLFSFMGDTVQKMTFRMEESDPWFETKQQQVEVLDAQLRKLHTSAESLIQHRKELTSALAMLAKSTALIGHDETNVSLSCALSHLAATHEKVERIYDQQTGHDILYMSELLRDYIGMIGAVKEAFHERVKTFQNLAGLEQTLNRKRESKAKMELNMRNERLSQLDDEIAELQEKVEKAKEDFEQISATIKQEFERFDLNRIRDFQNSFVKYMESMLETQQALAECWEAFLPEAKSIAA